MKESGFELTEIDSRGDALNLTNHYSILSILISIVVNLLLRNALINFSQINIHNTCHL